MHCCVDTFFSSPFSLSVLLILSIFVMWAAWHLNGDIKLKKDLYIFIYIFLSLSIRWQRINPKRKLFLSGRRAIWYKMARAEQWNEKWKYCQYCLLHVFYSPAKHENTKTNTSKQKISGKIISTRVYSTNQQKKKDQSTTKKN